MKSKIMDVLKILICNFLQRKKDDYSQKQFKKRWKIMRLKEMLLREEACVICANIILAKFKWHIIILLPFLCNSFKWCMYIQLWKYLLHINLGWKLHVSCGELFLVLINKDDYFLKICLYIFLTTGKWRQTLIWTNIFSHKLLFTYVPFLNISITFTYYHLKSQKPCLKRCQF